MLLQNWDSIHVLETGFCLGHSASIFLGLGVSSVTSIDPSERPQTAEAAAIMTIRHNSRFTFVQGAANSPGIYDKIGYRKYDLMFVDGDHTFEAVDADIRLGLELGIERFLLDDFFPHWGPGVQPAMRQHKLIPVAILGTMALAEVSHAYTEKA